MSEKGYFRVFDTGFPLPLQKILKGSMFNEDSYINEVMYSLEWSHD